MPKEPNPTPEPDQEDTDRGREWEKDQKARGYYYDDAYGYETFDPEKDEEAENEKTPGHE